MIRSKWMALCWMAAGCYHGGARRSEPVPDHADLIARMRATRSSETRYVGEARLTYFGPSGRIKGTATLAVKRPRSLRYEIQGPHGGVIEAFATNGLELQLLDFKSNRFVYGPANPQTLDRLLAFAPLHITVEEWVSLLFGEVEPPANSRVIEAGSGLKFIWQNREVRQELVVDRETYQISGLSAYLEEEVIWEVRVEKRGSSGLPEQLSIKMPSADVDMAIRLRDLEFGVDLGPEMFQISAPDSTERLYLGDVTASGD